MEENIEDLIEELTKVRPEMLNEEALKLFNTIMAILDERDKLKEENNQLKLKMANLYKAKGEYEKAKSIMTNELRDYIPKLKIKEKIEELKKEYEIDLEENSIKAFILKCQIEILEKLLEDK